MVLNKQMNMNPPRGDVQKKKKKEPQITEDPKGEQKAEIGKVFLSLFVTLVRPLVRLNNACSFDVQFLKRILRKEQRK